jgi:hypothetical protein
MVRKGIGCTYLVAYLIRSDDPSHVAPFGHDLIFDATQVFGHDAITSNSVDDVVLEMIGLIILRNWKSIHLRNTG